MVHPGVGQPVWFNQAHLFHISALEASEQESLIETLGTENVPRNAVYGDGSPIEADVLEHAPHLPGGSNGDGRGLETMDRG